jgi:hypothetical protein
LSLANTYHDLPIEAVRRLVGANAFDAYPRLDRAALGKVADRIGVPVSEIDTTPDLGGRSDISTTGTLAFRREGPWS